MPKSNFWSAFTGIKKRTEITIKELKNHIKKAIDSGYIIRLGIKNGLLGIVKNIVNIESVLISFEINEPNIDKYFEDKKWNIDLKNVYSYEEFKKN